MTSRSSPVLVTGGEVFSEIAVGGDHSCALTKDGAAWCWGRNDSGELGDGSTTLSSTPVPVTGDITFATIAAGSFHTCALTPKGLAYCWGQNTYGALGDGTTVDRWVPTRVLPPPESGS